MPAFGVVQSSVDPAVDLNRLIILIATVKIYTLPRILSIMFSSHQSMPRRLNKFSMYLTTEQ